DAAVRLNHGGELEAHAKLAKLNRDGGNAAGVLLRDGKGKFSSGEETGFLAIDRDQVGLGQNLQKILCLESLNHRAQVDLRVKEEQVEQVRYRRGRGRSSGNRGTRAANRAGDGVASAVGKQIEAQLGQSGTIHFRKLDFQKHFLCPDWAKGQHVHDILGIRRGQQARMFGRVLGGDVTRDNNRVTRRRHVDLLIREQAMHLFRSCRDVDIHAQIKAARALQFVPDQQRNLARSESIDQDLGWRDDQRIRHCGVGYRDALQSFGGVNQEGLTHHHAERRCSRGNALVGCRRGWGGRLRGRRIRRRHCRRILVLRRSRGGCRSGLGIALASYGARERFVCDYWSPTEKQSGCDERKSFHEFAPLRGCTSMSGREWLRYCGFKTCWFHPVCCH